jgi:death on curing protein
LPIEIPTEEQIVRLNNGLVTRSGEPHSLVDRAGLLSALGRPLHGIDGSFLYESIHEMGAALLESIAINHPFVSGNKRTALMAMEVFMHRNGHVLIATDDEKYDYVVGVVTHQLDFNANAEWLETHCHCIEPERAAEIA